VDDEGNPTAFTLFRPGEIAETGLCHPVITWGNGTGSNPGLYKTLLGHLASHGFVVIASDNPNVGDGDPAPMLVGVTWVLEQNEDPSSALYQAIDVHHIGGTGHSQGGFATTTAGGDERVTAIAPLCGASPQRNLHGPALLLCGGMDEVVPCDNIQRAYDGINDQPAMLANYLAADHANWVTFRGTTPSPMETAVTAWMRIHLMGDTALRSWFYGPDCKLCTDAAWSVQQKALEE
jgi:predicted dienelactone hydrolase